MDLTKIESKLPYPMYNFHKFTINFDLNPWQNERYQNAIENIKTKKENMYENTFSSQYYTDELTKTT